MGYFIKVVHKVDASSHYTSAHSELFHLLYTMTIPQFLRDMCMVHAINPHDENIDIIDLVHFQGLYKIHVLSMERKARSRMMYNALFYSQDI